MNDRLLDAVLAPGLWLSVGIALTYGTLCWSWFGGGARQFARDLLTALLGFALGQVAGSFLNVAWGRIGAVQVLTGTAGALLALWLGRFIAGHGLRFPRRKRGRSSR